MEVKHDKSKANVSAYYKQGRRILKEGGGQAGNRPIHPDFFI